MQMNNRLQILYTLIVVSTLSIASVIFSKVSNNNKLVATLVLYFSICLIVALTKLSWTNVGLSKDLVLKGAVTALPFMAVVIVGGLIVFLINPETFKDSRYQTDLKTMLTTIFLVLPLMTVILEELAFRGLLFGTLSTYLTQGYALLVSSISFGVWHIFSASNLDVSGIVSGNAIPKVLIVLTVVIATSIAGAFFTWLRIKSGSLIAPILLHWTINSTGVVLAYFAWSK